MPIRFSKAHEPGSAFLASNKQTSNPAGGSYSSSEGSYFKKPFKHSHANIPKFVILHTHTIALKQVVQNQTYIDGKEHQ